VLQRYHEIFRSLLIASDLSLVALCWGAAFFLRFYTVFPAPLGIPELEAYGPPLLVILPVWALVFRSQGLYEPRRTGHFLAEAGLVLRASTLALMGLVAMAFFLRSYSYSRGVVVIFSLLSVTSVTAARWLLRSGLRRARRRGLNLRHVLVVGGGELAGELIDRIHSHRDAGLRVRGVLCDRFGRGAVGDGRRLHGVPILGGYEALKTVLEAEPVDQVLLALPRDDAHQLEKLLAELDDEMVSVKLVPDLLQFRTLRSAVENLDGLPIIHLREGPLVGWAAVRKRAFDLAFASLGLVLLSPLLAGTALAIALTSGRPVLYRQRRMGLDGHLFELIKLRTMAPDAEPDGPEWTRAADPRRTRLGRVLRRFGIDELPQLWNVLRGDMSLVGPRPERPTFIEAFRSEVPGYMLRHKVKAGLTGWAQVHGWRGDTSLHERVEHDLYYIQNWSLGLDLRILLMTLWRTALRPEGY